MNLCPHCRQPFVPSSPTCPRCGGDLGQGEETKRSAPATSHAPALDHELRRAIAHIELGDEKLGQVTEHDIAGRIKVLKAYHWRGLQNIVEVLVHHQCHPPTQVAKYIVEVQSRMFRHLLRVILLSSLRDNSLTADTAAEFTLSVAALTDRLVFPEAEPLAGRRTLAACIFESIESFLSTSGSVPLGSNRIIEVLPRVLEGLPESHPATQQLRNDLLERFRQLIQDPSKTHPLGLSRTERAIRAGAHQKMMLRIGAPVHDAIADLQTDELKILYHRERAEQLRKNEHHEGLGCKIFAALFIIAVVVVIVVSGWKSLG